MRIVAAYAVCVLFGLMLLPAQSKATETDFGYSNRYGELTPTEVYALAQNLDAILERYVADSQPQLISELPEQRVEVEGYVPEQVFVALGKLRDNLDQLAKLHGVDAVSRVEREMQEAIPAEVFLQAGACLDTMAKILSVLRPNDNFGDFYHTDDLMTAKTPSDVFALVDLIDRKLIRVLNSSSQLKDGEI